MASVTNILIDVVPGNGDGVEIYAESCDDVVAVFNKLSDRIEDLEAELAAAQNTTVPSAAILLAEQVLLMDLISARGLRVRDLVWQVLGNNHDVHEGECADVLRSLASSLSAGGYNATVVDPAVFKEKILWGIAQIEAELAACKRDAERYRWLTEKAYVGIAPYPKPHEVWCLRLPNPKSFNNLDAAIDATMAAGEPK
jgi:hypothetical protein